ncbi:uracil-DNA glycosylase family protein [Sphingomonas sp. CJ20]
MGDEAIHDWPNIVASAIEWWSDAGVETLTDDEPRDWLAAPAPRADTIIMPAAVAAPVVEVLPDTLEAFVAWRLGEKAPEAGWMSPIVPPSGPADAALVVLTDVPESGDTDMLMSGPEGRMLDRMLTAIGVSRESVYLASLAVARPMTGRVTPDQEARLTELMRHHLSLLRPKNLLLLGQATGRLLRETAAAPHANRIHDVNDFGGNTAVVATYHPRFLLERPATKSEAWRHLLLASRGLGE